MEVFYCGERFGDYSAVKAAPGMVAVAEMVKAGSKAAVDAFPANGLQGRLMARARAQSSRNDPPLQSQPGRMADGRFVCCGAADRGLGGVVVVVRAGGVVLTVLGRAARATLAGAGRYTVGTRKGRWCAGKERVRSGRRERSSACNTGGEGMQRVQVVESWGGSGRKGACGARSSHERLVTSVVCCFDVPAPARVAVPATQSNAAGASQVWQERPVIAGQARPCKRRRSNPTPPARLQTATTYPVGAVGAVRRVPCPQSRRFESPCCTSDRDPANASLFLSSQPALCAPCLPSRRCSLPMTSCPL